MTKEVLLFDWLGFDFDGCDSHIEDMAQMIVDNEIILTDKTVNTTDLQTVTDYLYNNVKYNKQQYASEVLNNFEYMLNSYLNLNNEVNLTIANVYSPKFYNYETDRIYYNISDDVMQEIKETVLKDYKAELIAELKERFTAYDGFIPSYPNDLETFLNTKDDCITNSVYITTLLKQHMDYTDINYNHLEYELSWYELFEITVDYDYS